MKVSINIISSIQSLFALSKKAAWSIKLQILTHCALIQLSNNQCNYRYCTDDLILKLKSVYLTALKCFT